MVTRITPLESKRTSTTPLPESTESTTSFPETDDFLIVPMATVAGIVVFIILLTVVCFIVKTKRRARANVRRMLRNQARPMSQMGSLQTQSGPVSLTGSYQTQPRPDSQMNSLGTQQALREVHQPLYGPASFTTEVIWSKPPVERQDSPDYKNSPAPVQDPPPKLQSGHTTEVIKSSPPEGRRNSSPDYENSPAPVQDPPPKLQSGHTTEVIKSNPTVERRKSSPDYENSPAPVQDPPPKLQSGHTEVETRRDSDYVDTSGYKEDLSSIQKRIPENCDIPQDDIKTKSSKQSVNVNKEFSKESVTDKGLRKEKRKVKSKHSNRKKCSLKSKGNDARDTADVCKTGMDEGNTLDLPPPTPCTQGPKYANIDPDYPNDDVFENKCLDSKSFGYVNTRDILDHSYINITKAITFGKRGYSTSVLPRLEENISNKGQDYENAYMPMDVTGYRSAVPEDMYIAMDKTNAAYTESSTLPLYVNTNDEDLYINPSITPHKAQEWGRNKRYVNYPRSKSIDEVYSKAKSEHDFKIKF